MQSFAAPEPLIPPTFSTTLRMNHTYRLHAQPAAYGPVEETKEIDESEKPLPLWREKVKNLQLPYRSDLGGEEHAYYGFSMTETQLLDVAKQMGFVEGFSLLISRQVQRRLSKRCKFPILETTLNYYDPSSPTRTSVDFVFGIYANYSIHTTLLKPAHEEKLLGMLRRFLCIDEDVPATWWHALN